MVEKLQKAEGKIKGLTKGINDMRAVINTLAPILGEKGTKTIEDLRRQMVLMEEENIKLLNDKKTYFKKVSKKTFKYKKNLDFEVVFEITIDYLILIILKKN